MGQFRAQGFIILDDLEFAPDGFGIISVKGRVNCQYGLCVDVTKLLEIVEGDGAAALVQTFAYSYCAVLSGVGNVFRYDSAHATHNEDHHVHRYDVLNGDTRGTTTIHGVDRWPTLGEVVEELRGWAADHSEALSRPTQ